LKKIGIVAFAFGVPKTIVSNQRIAQIASQKALELNAPVYTQLDVAVGLGIEVTYTEETPGNPPPTLRIARGAVKWAMQYKIAELMIVAAKPQLWRALRDVKQAVREAKAQIEVRACEEIEQYPEYFWFCPDSTQDRVQSREAWDKRERILKLMPFFVYKRIAK
jgi:hypothetical protein